MNPPFLYSAALVYIYIISSVGEELYYFYTGIIGNFLTASEADEVAFQQLVIIHFYSHAAIFMPAFPAGLA